MWPRAMVASAPRRGQRSTSASYGVMNLRAWPKTTCDSRVAENHMRLAAALGYTRANLVTCTQVHGTGIAKVDGSDAGTKQTGCDGLMTDTLGLPLGLVFGDCVPVLLYDRVRNVLGVVHAGWRGTVNGAAAALLWAMQAGYSTQPGNVCACIGPSIGPASYAVGRSPANGTSAPAQRR